MSTRRIGPFVALEAATLLSATGNGIAMVALPWLVLQRTGSAAGAGLVAAAAAVPLLVASFVSGAVVDLVGRRRTSVVSDVLSGVSVAAIPVVAMLGDLTLAWIVVLAALGALFDPAGATARATMLPEAGALAGLRLERVNGIHDAVFGVAYLAAPGLGGLLLAVVGPEATLWATALGFGLSSVAALAVRVEGAGRPQTRVSDRGVLRDSLDGLRFVWADRTLRAVSVLFLLLVGAWLPIEGVLLPVHFQQQDAPGRLGLALMAMSGGGIVGSLLYGWQGHRFSRHRVLLVGLVGTALPVVGMATLPSFGWLLALGVLTGLMFGPINPITQVVTQERAPQHLRGRVMGAVTSLSYTAGPVGYLLAGPLVEWLGLRGAFLVLAAILLATALSALGLRALRGLDHTRPARGHADGAAEPTGALSGARGSRT